MKIFLNQLIYAVVVIHPFGETPYRDPIGPPFVQLGIRYLPVYITYGRTNLPSALTHTCTVMFSLPEPPMIAWGDLTPRLHTICAGLPLSGNPLSSTFKMHCGFSCRPSSSSVGYPLPLRPLHQSCLVQSTCVPLFYFYNF